MKKYDCLFIGNAIVDVVSNVSFEFLKEQNIDVGSWRPTAVDQISQLQKKMENTLIASGGSAANSAVGFSLLGGNSSFIGRVKDDEFGKLYIKDLQSANVDFVSSSVKSGIETGRCLVYVTPDAQRSMRTYLGAASNLSPDEINENAIEDSEFVYMEGYLWDEPIAKEACKKSYDLSKKFGTKSVLSLSDSFCVEKWRSEIRELVKISDIIFGNEEEVMSLYDTSIFSDAISAANNEMNLCIITRGDKGSIIVSSEGIEEVPAFNCDKVVDTTGAGDLYAAGFLYGLKKNLRLYECAQLGSFCSSQVISLLGPRPLSNLALLAKDEGFLV
jgi:sugar/nucleoside kinase (ribokinase family)